MKNDFSITLKEFLYKTSFLKVNNFDRYIYIYVSVYHNNVIKYKSNFEVFSIIFVHNSDVNCFQFILML